MLIQPYHVQYLLWNEKNLSSFYERLGYHKVLFSKLIYVRLCPVLLHWTKHFVRGQNVLSVGQNILSMDKTFCPTDKLFFPLDKTFCPKEKNNLSMDKMFCPWTKYFVQRTKRFVHGQNVLSNPEVRGMSHV